MTSLLATSLSMGSMSVIMKSMNCATRSASFLSKPFYSAVPFVPTWNLATPNASEEDIKLALDIAQATHFVSKKEQGLDSVVEHGGKNFSGGQKQRLCIARALVKKPEIYIFDDSFSALDFKTDIKLRTALKGYTKDSSVIIVAQRVSTILDADDIVVLSDGKIVGEGTHRQLLKSCQVYQEIVYSQLDKEEIAKTMKLAEAFSSEGGER